MKPSHWKIPRCPICGAGFTLKQRPTPRTLKLIEEAIVAHQAEHAKIAITNQRYYRQEDRTRFGVDRAPVIW